MLPSVSQMEQYIRSTAPRYGINPDIAVRVAKSEGLAPGVWQSNIVKNGKREPSYGPFQLYTGGGLGNQFASQTGLDPSDPGTWQKQIDFALNTAKSSGWSHWYGSKAVGISPWQGIKDGGSSLSPEQSDFVKNNPQPDNYAGLSGGGAPFGSMAPASAPSPVPVQVAQYAASDEKKRRNRKFPSLDELLVPAPRPSAFPGGPSEAQANALTKYLNSPTIADLLLNKRV